MRIDGPTSSRTLDWRTVTRISKLVPRGMKDFLENNTGLSRPKEYNSYQILLLTLGLYNNYHISAILNKSFLIEGFNMHQNCIRVHKL